MPVTYQQYKKAKVRYWVSSIIIFLLGSFLPAIIMFYLLGKIGWQGLYPLGILFTVILLILFKGTAILDMFTDSSETIKDFKHQS